MNMRDFGVEDFRADLGEDLQSKSYPNIRHPLKKLL